ncbi:MAG: WYL domain-containing transcriptional regulator [Epsilonproteobacteria bacterium]|nr:WYL domain-containing transcriptional regulator [Campylobacterota bacterium]
MSQKSSLYRTIEILKMLNSGKKLCVTNLAMVYEVSDRTIRRDFELIREIFGDFMRKEGECYKAYKKVLLEDLLMGADLMTLANIINLFGQASMEESIDEQTKDLVKKSLRVYDFKTRPFEHVENREIVKKLEYAIKFNKEIRIEYQISRGSTKRWFHPYKILFINENFYLVGENISRKCFEFLRTALILDIEESKKTFYQKADMLDFIQTIQTPWASFGKEEITVRLRVDSKIRKYFLMKKYLPSQKIVQTFEDGDIEVQYVVSNLREIEELVIKWLPQVKIIAPKNLKRMIKKVLSKKMEGIKGTQYRK